MKTITVQIKEDTAKDLIAVLKSKRAALLDQVAQLNLEIEGVTRYLSPVNEPPTAFIPSLPLQPSPAKSASGKRAKKGASKVVIEHFLKVRNGTGATIKEITAETGTVYGTTRRILDGFLTNDLVSAESGLWKWKGN